MERMAIVVRDDAYDKLLTPLTFAQLAADEGTQVDMLFVLWAVRVLTETGAKETTVDGRHAADEPELRETMRAAGEPVEIADQLRDLVATGRVNLYACRVAAATFGVSEADLMAGVSGIVDATWFLRERAIPSAHCQYF